MNKKRILIISGEAWRNESNGGNVLSNLFGTLIDDYEFAQIYTNPALPSNVICNKYFHLSESEMLQTVFKRKYFGKVLTRNEFNKVEGDIPSTTNSKVVFIKKHLLNIAFLFQDILWRYSKWKSPQLEQFIVDFNPDLIFAPMYYGIHLHRLDRYAAELTGKKLISYVSDDHLTFRQFSVSPIYWLNRLILRNNVLTTAKFYSLLYTMTQEQLDEYQPVLIVPMKVLKKAGDFQKQPLYTSKTEKPFVISYGGNLIYNRYKTLAKLAEAVKTVNQDKQQFVLNIYTQTPITTKLTALLDDGQNTFLKGKVTMNELEKVYANSDIVLHVESFDLKQRLLTRLSFSTKIIDLLHSGRCIMAICWDKSSPFKYLQDEDAAICIADSKTIEKKLQEIIKDPTIIEQYADKAWLCGVRNHSKSKVISSFKTDLESLIL
jgi:hypothetical protein